MKDNPNATDTINERRRKPGRPALVWTPEQREIIETWEGSVPGLARTLGCSVGKAHATLKSCEEVAE
jgi:hypothetical protein